MDWSWKLGILDAALNKFKISSFIIFTQLKVFTNLEMPKLLSHWNELSKALQTLSIIQLNQRKWLIMAKLILLPHWWSHWNLFGHWLYPRISDNFSPVKARNQSPKEECQTQTPNRRLTLTPETHTLSLSASPPPSLIFPTPLSLMFFPHFAHNSHT